MPVLKNFAQLNSNVHAELNGHLNNMDRKDKQEETDIDLNGLGLASKDANQSEDIVIVGTGDLAKGLLTLLTRRGYRVVVASRNPERNRSRVEDLGGEIENYKNALNRSKIVIVAIPLEGFQSLPADLFEGKIVIDVSNRTLKGNANKPSLANQLQELLPGSKVVKAFNTLSAYALQNNIFQGSKEVPIYSDDEEAKSIVVNLVRNLGLMPVDRGSLTSVTEIEGITLALFPDWKLAGKLSLALLIFFFIIQTSRDQICPNIQRSDDKPWDWKLFHKFPLVTIHAASAAVALTLLTSCYLPGVIAAYLQLYRGTKYSEFPKWLDLWMRSRKQIGLMAEFFAAMHTLMAAFDVIRRGVSEWRDFSYIAFVPPVPVLKNFAQLNPSVHAELNGYLNNMGRKDKQELEIDLNGVAFKDANQSEDIVIVGTGDLAKGLLTLLTRRGYRVVVASRNPEKNRSRVEDLGGEIENYKNALNRGKIVIVAIPLEGFQSLRADLFEGKIVIDVSNRTLKGSGDEPSLACRLQELLPGSRVVKAFNTLSAYELQNNIFQGSKEIFIILPLITLILKLLLILPCVDSHLQKIRRGYERTPEKENPA